jgi:hypothetical protein
MQRKQIVTVPIGFKLQQIESDDPYVQQFLIEPPDNIKFFELLIREFKKVEILVNDLDNNPKLYNDVLELVRTKTIEEFYKVSRKQLPNHTTRNFVNNVCRRLHVDFVDETEDDGVLEEVIVRHLGFPIYKFKAN